MTQEEKEVQIQALGAPWPKLMVTFRNARDTHSRLVDSAGVDDTIKQAWRECHARHYEELLDLILKLSARQHSN